MVLKLFLVEHPKPSCELTGIDIRGQTCYGQASYLYALLSSSLTLFSHHVSPHWNSHSQESKILPFQIPIKTQGPRHSGPLRHNLQSYLSILVCSFVDATWWFINLVFKVIYTQILNMFFNEWLTKCNPQMYFCLLKVVGFD